MRIKPVHHFNPTTFISGERTGPVAQWLFISLS